MVIIQLTPVCGSAVCAARVREGLLRVQREAMERARGEVWDGACFGKMGCAVCGSEEGKRCAGCGSVAYCCKE